MGAHPYWYAVKYRPEIDLALADLREREFRAGRYNPVMPFIDFPITPASPASGPRHRTIDDAIAASDADGTRSILDISGTADEPDFGVACPLPPEVLRLALRDDATDPGRRRGQHGISGGRRAGASRVRGALHRRHPHRLGIRRLLV